MPGIKLFIYSSALCLAETFASADAVVTLPSVLYWSGAVGPVAGGTYGYSFTVGSTPLSVTSLGLFGEVAATPHPVGIWNVGGSLLGSITIPAGPGVPV